MERLSSNIATNLRRIRKMKNMSLDHAAIQTGVSKSMLAQIERGEANPTIGILEKIVDGMRVSFDELIARQEVKGYIVEKSKMVPIKAIEGKYRIYSCLPYEKGRNLELYVLELEPGCSYCPDLYGERSYAYIEVTAGELEISVGTGTFRVNEGDFFYFDAEKEHAYHNKSEKSLNVTVFLTLQ